MATSSGSLTLLKAGPVTLQLNMITLLFCWSVTEVLRYGFYAAKVRPDLSVNRKHIHMLGSSCCIATWSAELILHSCELQFCAGVGCHAICSLVASLLYVCDPVSLGSGQRDDNGVPGHAGHPQGAAAQLQHAQ